MNGAVQPAVDVVMAPTFSIAMWFAAIRSAHRWRAPVLRSGLEMLRPGERRPPRMPNQTSQLTEQRVVAFSLGHPGLGPRRVLRVIGSLDERLQLIVLDHTDLDEPWFQEEVVENWRNGRALVPEGWIGSAD